MRPSLVTPSTSSATSGPNAAFTSSAVRLGVLHGVMQQRGHHGVRVQAQVHHKARHGNGVADIAFAGKARLPRMGRRSHLVSLFDAPGVVWAAGIRHGLRQVFKSLYGILSLSSFHHCAASQSA